VRFEVAHYDVTQLPQQFKLLKLAARRMGSDSEGVTFHIRGVWIPKVTRQTPMLSAGPHKQQLAAI